MNCIHCKNTPGQEYYHELSAGSYCGECGHVLPHAEDHVRYMGLTEIRGRLVHLYERISALPCSNCGTALTMCYYDCEEDGASFLLTANFAELGLIVGGGNGE